MNTSIKVEKVVNKVLNTKTYQMFDDGNYSLEDIAKQTFVKFFNKLKKVKHILSLNYLEIESTFIIAFVKENQAYIIVSGDGCIVADDKEIKLESIENAPDYLVYHLNEKVFDVYENNKLVSTFVFNDRKIHKEDNESSSTTYFNQHLLPIKIVSVDKRYNFNIEITFEYNKFNDLITEKVKYDDAPMIIKSYKYLFDEKNNWIERKEYENGKLIFTTKRKIEYN